MGVWKLDLMFPGNLRIPLEHMFLRNCWAFGLVLLTKQGKGTVDLSRWTQYARRIDEF